MTAEETHRRPRKGTARERRERRERRRRMAAPLVRGVAPLLFRLFSLTWRYEVLGAEHRAAAEEGGGSIFTMWHGRMLLPVRHFRRVAAHYTILVSRSGDGDLSEVFLQGCGFPVVRGSSSRGRASALRALLTVLRRGDTVVVTPDGPRGPRHRINQGVAWLAKATGRPALPAGFACSRCWELPTWDRYNVPKPFARIVISYGEPVHVPRDTDDEGLERCSEEIRSRLVQAERRAFAHLGREDDL